MAIQSVATEGRDPFYLPYDTVNEIGGLCAQARGIAACIGAASTEIDQIPDDAIPCAAWALQELIERIGALTTMRHAPGGAA